jgi:hypothetical protein
MKKIRKLEEKNQSGRFVHSSNDEADHETMVLSHGVMQS